MIPDTSWLEVNWGMSIPAQEVCNLVEALETSLYQIIVVFVNADPLFYVHHANLDRIWRQWQLSKPGRLWEISGRSTTDPPYEEVTLDYPLVMGSLGPTTPIRQVMDTLSNTSCYTYA